MNFTRMPELTWRWGYLFVWVIILVIVFIMLAFFRHKKWL
jgi:magnesium transporter